MTLQTKVETCPEIKGNKLALIHCGDLEKQSTINVCIKSEWLPLNQQHNHFPDPHHLKTINCKSWKAEKHGVITVITATDITHGFDSMGGFMRTSWHVIMNTNTVTRKALNKSHGLKDKLSRENWWTVPVVPIKHCSVDWQQQPLSLREFPLFGLSLCVFCRPLLCNSLQNTWRIIFQENP